MRMLASFLRTHRERIVAEWERRTMDLLPTARELSHVARRDHVPQILEAMAAAVEREDTTTISLDQLPLAHADERWAQDYGLREVVDEYRLLRRVILDVYVEHLRESAVEVAQRLPSLVTLNENIDHAITDAVDHYSLQRDRTREYFVGMLSHDLRDPLGSIAMGAELLQRPDLSPEQWQRAAARVAASAARMRGLIDDMLDVTRSRLGPGVPVSPVPTDLRAVVDDTVDELAAAHPDRTIAREPDDSIDLRGVWDPLRLAQVVSNLVANALKHGTGPIRVGTGADEDTVRLEVSNRGAIPAALRAHLFDPFETRDPSAGAGLGLFIASEIARAHGGTLDLLEAGEQETRFRLVLPRGSVPLA